MLPQFADRESRELGGSALGLLHVARIERVHLAVAGEHHHRLSVPSQRLAFEPMAIDERTKHELLGRSARGGRGKTDDYGRELEY